MSKEKKLIDMVKHLFTYNPDQKAVHITSDGQTFWQHHKAAAHAKSLREGGVTSIERKISAADEKLLEAIQNQREGVPSQLPPAGSGEGGNGGDGVKKDITEMDVKELKAELDELEVEYAKSWNKAKLIEVLTAKLEEQAAAEGGEDNQLATIEELKEQLDEKEISYDDDADREALVALLEAAEEPGDGNDQEKD